MDSKTSYFFAVRYTLTVYIRSVIYTPSTLFIKQKFGVSLTAISLNLAFYVLSCKSLKVRNGADFDYNNIVTEQIGDITVTDSKADT